MDLFDQLLFDALSYHDLKKHFENKIDYEKWQRNLRSSGFIVSSTGRGHTKIPLLTGWKDSK
jgi:hypothetical protein